MRCFFHVLLCIVLFSCSGEKDRTPDFPYEISFDGIGARGIFDPSLSYDPDDTRIWIVYSAVEPSIWEANMRIHTRLAYSDDAGLTWVDRGIILNESEDVTLPLEPPDNAGTWVHEVPSLLYDPAAPLNERWKLLWHRYLMANGDRVFEHGWIGYKAAESPELLKDADERKLFAGSAYNDTSDAIIGPPEIRLDEVFPELASCLVFSEPALAALDGLWYVSMLGAEGTSQDGKVIVLQYDGASSAWGYAGAFLENTIDGPALGYHGYSAPSLYQKDQQWYLMVSPQINDVYLGTLVFRIEDLASAVLQRSAGKPDSIASVYGTEGSHNGAAGYIDRASACGILYSEVLLEPPLHFRMYASGVNP
jgi:hypothetical protein